MVGLNHLEDTIRRDLEFLNYPSHSWVKPRQTSDGKSILDVLIIGAGQGGLGVAFGLMQEKIKNILVIDENPQGQEGPWRTFARMPTLRTPKHVSGPDFGIPSLSFRAWYEAQNGAEGWQKLGFIPKELWADYLSWYRKFLQIPVQNETRAGAIEWLPKENCFAIPIEERQLRKTVFARKIILATGIDGSGKWEVPSIIGALPKKFYAHTREEIDFSTLKNKRVGVLGAGASAFDNAAVALEHQAQEVHLLFRRKKLPNVNPYRWSEFVGFLKHHGDLSDEDRWRFILQINRMGQLPPKDTFARCQQFKNFFIHAGSPCRDISVVDSKICMTTAKGKIDLDFLIIGSGFVTDLSLRPELKNLHSQIALWKDRYSPPLGQESEDLSNHPYLGQNFEFQPKTPNEQSPVSSLFNYTFGGLLSLGLGGASISGMKYSLPRIVSGVTRQLYMDDSQFHFNTLQNYNEVEFSYEFT